MEILKKKQIVEKKADSKKVEILKKIYISCGKNRVQKYRLWGSNRKWEKVDIMKKDIQEKIQIDGKHIERVKGNGDSEK